jgi:hypothetical protein
VVEIEKVDIVILDVLIINMVFIIEIVYIMVVHWKYMVFGNVVVEKHYQQELL